MARRYSIQKQMIGATLAQLDHPTAAEVYEKVRKDYPQISLGTVYRNLSLMADGGEILRLSFPDAPDRFDPNAHEHYHVVCNRCGRIYDTDHTIPAELITRIDQAVEACTGVRVENRMMIFSGVCAACRSDKK